MDQATPAPIAENVVGPMDWEKVATVLYNELKRWGWGDFHYGSQGEQEKSVLAALRVYEDYVTPWAGESTDDE